MTLFLVVVGEIIELVGVNNSSSLLLLDVSVDNINFDSSLSMLLFSIFLLQLYDIRYIRGIIHTIDIGIIAVTLNNLHAKPTHINIP